MSVRIRKARKEDIEAIHAIKREQFPNPWKKEFFIDELTHNISNFYAAEENGSAEIAGYIIFWIIEETLELHDIAVKETYKRKGVGARLLDFMFETAGARDVEEMFLEVRASNGAAITFYEKYNFKQISVRKNYYKDPLEDALVYCLKLTPGNRVL
ncbi:MAG: ribosomal protein S18-alanine N-acetyltransferase [bacterium]|nr:ribosomal protein S18-alanine N-acetyltransferase [bacterium]